MKRILITGKDSYIGTSVEKWLAKEPEKYSVDTIDMRDGSWKEHDFSQYDVVFHVAGIAHRKGTRKDQGLFYTVNRDLAYETAKKAKGDGVDHFIFLSSMSVYGIANGIINQATLPKPKSVYGKSKIEAEELIRKLQDDTFAVVILRPPMVYGKGCKGNYPKLAKLTLNTPIFPKVDNKRSMIYIDNLSMFVKVIIDNELEGLFFPQNAEYVNTSEMVRLIAKVHGKRVLFVKPLNSLLKLCMKKVFGDLVYEMDMSQYQNDYRVTSFNRSIELTEE